MDLAAPPQTAFVIGGGIVGQSIALKLQLSGIWTVLIDAGGPPPASWGNAGHIAVEQVDPLASRATIRSFSRRLFARGGALALPPADISAWLPFALRLIAASAPDRFAIGQDALKRLLAHAVPSWRALLDQAGAPDLLREDGHYVVWESAESARAGAARWKAAPHGTATVHDATDAELAMLRTLGTAPIAGAIRFAGSGQIADLGLLAQSLDTAFRRAGGTVRTGTAATLTPIPDGMSVTMADGERIDAAIGVVAAGARSGTLLRPLGYRAPLIAERGYHIQSAETDWPERTPPVVYEDRSMIVTRFRSGLRAASFVEFGRVDSPPDPRKWARLRAHVTALGLSFTQPGAPWMGARPTLPDYLPAIGRSEAHPNLIYAFGHQHLGLTLAAITAEAIAALACRNTPPLDLSPFNLSRFGGKK
jgi:D-amino-acid dehydrogenase